MPQRRGTVPPKRAAFAFLSPKTVRPGCLLDKALPCLSHTVLMHSAGWLRNPAELGGFPGAGRVTGAQRRAG